VSATASGDKLQLTFASGTPQFQIARQTDAHYFEGGKGSPVNLAGSAGLRIAMQGFRGDIVNYSGSKTLTSNGQLLLQVAYLEDFEGYEAWGVGLSAPGCANVTASGSTLTFTFMAAS
jgi:hypothetical protein